jgi:superfamily II DNA or RNA helicase
MNPRPHQLEAKEILSRTNRGIVAMAPGAGKTLIQILDVENVFKTSNTPQIVVVVAPRILLASQLSFDYQKHFENVKFLHVHSKNGKVKHYHTTNPDVIKEWTEIHSSHHRLIFTTYHSLKKIYKSKISVNTFLFDEAHNSTSAGFHEYVKKVCQEYPRTFHFSGSPKYSNNPKKPGMNDSIYGGIIAKATATEMIEKGYTLKPRVISHYLEWVEERTPENDSKDILNIIQSHGLSKVLINVKCTKSMFKMLSETDFQTQVNELGYDLLHITSNYGAVCNGKKIERDRFFRLLEEFGKSKDKKYIILNYSILGEGININSLDAVILFRQHNLIKLIQTIGRTLRISVEDQKNIDSGVLTVKDYKNYFKPEGLVIIPVYNKKLLNISKSIKTTVDNIYEKGELPIMSV